MEEELERPPPPPLHLRMDRHNIKLETKVEMEEEEVMTTGLLMKEEMLAELQDIADMLEVPEDLVGCLDGWEVMSTPAAANSFPAGLCGSLTHAQQFDLGGEELWAASTAKTDLEWMESLIRL
jgi:hypothetical protein